jgi:tight adherence protein B
MNGLEVGACGALFGMGLVGVLWSWRTPSPVAAPGPSADADPAPPTTLPPISLASAAPVVLAIMAGGLAALATGWPVAVPIVGVACYGVPRLFGHTSGEVSIVKLEAIATWTEMLQGTLAASAGLGQAIMATAPLSPPPIRGATTRLASRLGAGMHPDSALTQFADELADPCSDRVVCALQLAVSARAQRLGDLLAALSDSTRDEVALRLRVETSRASVRSGVRTVLVFSLAFAVALVLVAHTYLAPFGTAQGQLVLLAVGVLYAVGLTTMVSLARPPTPVRLLGQQVVEV